MNTHSLYFRQSVLLILLVGVILGCLVWYGTLTPAPQAGVPPGNTDVITSYDNYVGESVVVHGPVLRTDPLTIEIAASDDTSLLLTVTGTNRSPAPGDVLSVYGTLSTGQVVSAENVVVKPSGSYWRTRILSLLAGLWVLWRGVRYWQPETQDLTIVRQTSPLETTTDWFGWRKTEEDDA